jgi:hypothetical protein
VQLWQLFAGVDCRIAEHPTRFTTLARDAAAVIDDASETGVPVTSSNAVWAQIELDLGRTFPGLCEDVAFRRTLRSGVARARWGVGWGVMSICEQCCTRLPRTILLLDVSTAIIFARIV